MCPGFVRVSRVAFSMRFRIMLRVGLICGFSVSLVVIGFTSSGLEFSGFTSSGLEFSGLEFSRA